MKSIEFAPKDGTVVLGYAGDEAMMVGYENKKWWLVVPHPDPSSGKPYMPLRSVNPDAFVVIPNRRDFLSE